MNSQNTVPYIVTSASSVEILHRDTAGAEGASQNMTGKAAGKQAFDGKLIKHIAGRSGLYIAVLAVCIYSAFPIYWMLISSLREPQKLFLDTSLVFWPPDLSSYKSLLELTNYPVNFINSVLLALATIVAATILSSFIAYGATRLRFRGKTMLIASMLFA
jgi:multiple sugar transport system permease protein